ncbi:unnamed protein product [Caenorhabditis nigoni]
MAGRKSSRTTGEPVKKAEKKSAILSPHDELRERLLETSLDVKENIPERSSSTRNGSVGSQRSDCSESRKRRSTEKGPAAKRPSTEKKGNGSRDDSFSSVFSEDRETESSVGSTSSRTRGQPLPAMPEEEESLDGSSDHNAESEESRETPHSDEHDDLEDDDVEDDVSSDVNDEEDEYDEYEEDEETEDEFDLPLQNADFAVTKRLMNDRHMIDAPSLLSYGKCEGIGSPTKVWSLMVKRDDIPRATRQLLRDHPGMTISMRRVLVDWMMECCHVEKLHRETFHLAVDYVDRFLESTREEVSGENFQLVGTAALFIAAKYEEIYPPKCADLAALTDGAFSCDDICRMESIVAKDLKWSFGPITSVQWLSTYLQLLGTGKKNNDHFEEGNMYIPELLRSEYLRMVRILDYLLSDIDSFNFSYRTIAAAVLFVNYDPRSAVERATGFIYEQLQNVIEYVTPICRAYDRFTTDHVPKDVIPEYSPAEDAHNIQVHIEHCKVDPYVEKERERRRRRGPNRRL